MDFFLNPNVAYLVLVLAVILTSMAVIVPGTGLLEVGALFALIWTAYAVYNLTINWWALLILALGVFPFLLAVLKSRRLIFLGLTILSMVVGSVFLFRTEDKILAVNPFFSLTVSVLAAFFLWISVRRSLEASLAPRAHNPDKTIGQTGLATTDVYEEGSVQLESELWSARSEEAIPAGSQVRVIGREGLVLVVEKA